MSIKFEEINDFLSILSPSQERLFSVELVSGEYQLLRKTLYLDDSYSHVYTQRLLGPPLSKRKLLVYLTDFMFLLFLCLNLCHMGQRLFAGRILLKQFTISCPTDETTTFKSS